MSLTGQLLLAMPQMMDERFARSVVYVCAHSGEAGAMGLVINKLLGSLTMGELFAQLDISPSGGGGSRPVHYGGPVEAGRGFVLDTAGYNEGAPLGVNDNLGLTATLHVLRAIGQGLGRRRSPFPRGSAGRAPSQRAGECQPHGWRLVPADDAIIFDPNHDQKWQRALAKLGVDLTMLSSEAGHA